MIPPTFLFEIGKKSPFLIDNGRFHQISDVETGTKNEKSFKIDNVIMYAVPSLKLEEMEEIYFEKNNKEIHKFQEEYIHSIINDAELYYEEDIKKFLKNNEIVEFIINKIFPYFIDNEDDIKKILNKEDNKEKEKYLDNIVKKEDKFFQEIVNQKLKEKKQNFVDIKYQLIDEINKEEAIKEKKKEDKMMSNEELEIKSLLAKADPEKYIERIRFLPDDVLKKKIICFLGEVYIQENDKTKHYGILQELENTYTKNLEKKIKLQSIEKYEKQLQVMSETKAKSEAIKDILNKEEFSIGDIGFLKKDEGYYVYLKVPEYALKYPSEETYYKFSPCRVAARICKGEKGFYSDDAKVIENYSHPFLSSNCSWQKICLGGYSKHGKDDAEKIADHLSTAKKVIMRGYVDEASPHHNLSFFSSKIVSKKTLDKEGTPITNVWRKK